MSATNFYLDKGFTPSNRITLINGLDTIAVWTPTTSTRVVLTEMSLSANYGGTIAFYFGNLAGTRFAEFLVGASSTITPAIGAVESTMYDRVIFAKVGTSGTDGWRVNLTGFELQ